LIRVLAGYVSDLVHRNWMGIKNRTKILLNKQLDPFDCYNFLIENNRKHEIDSIYFFLVGDYGKNDKNIAASNRKFQSLIKHVTDYSRIGIHPSFASNKRPQQLKIEISRLSKITHKQIRYSRQNFSLLKFTYTYNSLLEAGINEDFSMGYTNMNGFRASYCFSYKWYNIEEETVSSLTINPFAFTEDTVAYYANENKTSFLETLWPFANEVIKFGGQLISVFHNNTFDESMKINYLEFVQKIKAHQNTRTINQQL
jgi:hypothetical protein